jgi:hypothetical protein
MTRISKEFVQSLLETGALMLKKKIPIDRMISLYQPLPNKEELVGVLIEREANRHLKLLEEKYELLKDQDLEKIVMKLIREIAHAMDDGKIGIKVILTSTFAVERLEKLIQARRSLVSFVEKVLKDQGVSSSVKASLIVASLGGVVQTLVFTKETDLSDDDFILEATKMILAYIKSEN